MKKEISWVRSKAEASYWWNELETLQFECWDVIKKNCPKETLRKFMLEVDMLIDKYGLSPEAQAITGSAMIKRFIFSKYPDLKPNKYLKGLVD